MTGLRGAVEKAVAARACEILDVEAFGARGEGASDGGVRLPAEGLVLEEVELSLLRQALGRTGGNQTRAARLLGLSRDTLRYRVGKLGLGRPSGRS
jgi:DNA-binding NtrC family response regulator